MGRVGGGEPKFVKNGQGHINKMAATAIYGKKTFKNLLQNQKSDINL